MRGFEDLYQEIMVDHSKRPRDSGSIPRARRKAEGYNPLCRDPGTIQLKLETDRIADIAFQGSGCAISTAAASLLTECLKGKTRPEAERLLDRFHDLLTGETAASDLGKLAVFS